MFKPNTSPKSPRIELSNNTFAKRKCCQVFEYESETFPCRRSNGISHCENEEKEEKEVEEEEEEEEEEEQTQNIMAFPLLK